MHQYGSFSREVVSGTQWNIVWIGSVDFPMSGILAIFGLAIANYLQQILQCCSNSLFQLVIRALRKSNMVGGGNADFV